MKRPAALITGGAVRIGHAICKHLASAGYDIAIHCNSSMTEAKELKKHIELIGQTAVVLKANLGKAEQVEKLIDKAFEAFPNLDLLINNASIFEPSDLRTFTNDSLDRHFNINFKAPMILTREFAKHCRSGQIINILDTHITDDTTAHTTYLLSKKALRDLTLISAKQLAPKIRVNAIAPGLILPPADKPKNHLDRLAKNVPLKRKGDLENITQSVEFLLKNDYVNGQIIYNDGGEHLA